MAANNDDGGIDLSGAATGSGKSDSSGRSGGSGGGGGRRSPIYVKSQYGTRMIDTDETCAKCDNRAVGVVVREASKAGPDCVGKQVTPLCSNHKAQLKRKNPDKFLDLDYRTFV